jgi:hypothetical protein
VNLTDLLPDLHDVPSVVAVILILVMQAANSINLRRVESKAATAANELRPNGGASMRDAVTRTEATIAEQAADLAALRVEVQALRERVAAGLAEHRAIHDRLDDLQP